MSSEPTTDRKHSNIEVVDQATRSPETFSPHDRPHLHPHLKTPLLHQTQQQQQLPTDCLPCKVIGCAGFGGLGLYSFYQAQQLPKTLVARRLGLGLLGTGMFYP
ncbi:hypothetical protein BX616_006245, partial [Lobosporangium transversale]